jgi:hypothetical protein
MRIKKKHVLLESLLIDVTTEFTPVEKKIFKILNKHYGDPMKEEEGKKSFNQWDSAAWLIETLNIPYEDAYELTKTYFWNYKKLFKEVSKLRKKVPISYLFFEHYSKLLEKLVKTGYEDSIYTNVMVNIDRDSGFEDNRTVRLWSGFKGFTLYIPMDVRYVDNDYNTFISSRNASDRQIMVKGKFFPMDKEGIKVDRYISDEEWENDIDENKFMVVVNTEFGDNESKVDEELMVFEAPYPKPFIQENFNKIILSIVDDTIEKISKTTFKLPDNVGSINVNSYPIN